MEHNIWYVLGVLSGIVTGLLAVAVIAWIAKKEKAMAEAGAQWEGGMGEPMARNMTAIEYTRERCYHLISLID